ncbi:MAG: HDOD domain-containing protein [Ectothiorhodospiraceae bacterium]|nr:HDOD domain-containing protein [Ectothiorhodospiraceae bacterium]
MPSPNELRASGTLPSLPYVAHEILLTLSASEVNLSDVAASLDRDPGLTARLVAMANSAYFAGYNPVYSVEEAVMRLGLNRVRTLATSILLSGQFYPRRCPAFDASLYWYHAMGTAFAAGQLARYLPVGNEPDAAHLAGLLHTIGLLLLVHTFPADMDRILKQHREEPEQDLHLLERRTLGLDHYKAGAMLLEEWEVPALISDAVGAFADPVPPEDCRDLVIVLQAASEWLERDFEGVPDALVRQGMLPSGVLEGIRKSCQREQEGLRAMGRLLASG